VLDAGPDRRGSAPPVRGGLHPGLADHLPAPPYAHELNPAERVWSHLKRSLANLAKRNLTQLTTLVKTRLKRMQYRSSLPGGFLASTGLDLTPFQ
jgi:transposase